MSKHQYISPYAPWSFETAIEVWRSAGMTASDLTTADSSETEAEDDMAFAIAEAAEIFILEHTPSSLSEVSAILEVIAEAPDFRVDGLDRAAIQRVRAFIPSLS